MAHQRVMATTTRRLHNSYHLNLNPTIIHPHTSSYQISKAVETLATLYEVPPSLDVKSASSLDRSATE
eukprot:scaffold1306_cov98-Skeletonema_dohrnii-CCMP3373.AAC.4